MIEVRRLDSIADAALIEQTMMHPQVYRWIIDDGAPSVPAGYMPSPLQNHVGCYSAGRYVGLFVFTQRTDAVWEVHTCLLPEARGPVAKECAKAAAQWLWDHDDRAARIVSMVPSDNALALRFALASGMKEWGRNPKAYRRGGVLHDEVWVGMSRPEGV